MRISVELAVSGSTVADLMTDATHKWREFIGDEKAELPYDTEIDVKTEKGDGFSGTVHIRYKTESHNG